MRASRIVLLTLLLGLAAGRAWPAPEQAASTDADPARRVSQLEDENKCLRADAEFARRRMALLEEEAERLRGVVKARQDADDQAANRLKRQEIERDVERLRGLRFLHPVDFREIPRTELPAILRQKLAQQVPDQEFDDASMALAALGVLPAGTDLKKTYVALLGEQIGAFYDQHEKQLFTFSGQPLSGSQNRVIMAHELTHALEDQHFDLSKLPIEAKGNDDRVLAATALVEGDATLVMNRYMVGDLSAASVRDALASTLTTDVRQLASAPRYLRETLLFPYLRGQEFCTELYAHGGWDALAEAFRHPPSSSSQVLHPELYLAKIREEPVTIEFGDLEVGGLKPREDNVLGEFGARQLFMNWLQDKARTEEAASAWRGDRYLVYSQDKTASYVWKTACRDHASAQRFYEAARDSNSARYRLNQAHDGKAADSVVLSSMTARPPGRKVELCLTATHEVIVIDAQESLSAALTDRFAPGIRFSDP